MADPQTGEVCIPNSLVGWTGTDGKAETVAKTPAPVKLKFKDWDPVPVRLPNPNQSAAYDTEMTVKVELIKAREVQMAA